MSSETKTYRVSTWDHESDDWHVENRGVWLWGLRPVIRALRQLWDDCSILVECEQEYIR